MPYLIQQSIAAAARERDQQRTDFAELKRIHEEHGSEWIIESVAEIEEELRDCTCRLEPVTPTMVSPPEVRRNVNCPVHGIDPDYERERLNDKTGD